MNPEPLFVWGEAKKESFSVTYSVRAVHGAETRAFKPERLLVIVRKLHAFIIPYHRIMHLREMYYKCINTCISHCWLTDLIRQTEKNLHLYPETPIWSANPAVRDVHLFACFCSLSKVSWLDRVNLPPLPLLSHGRINGRKQLDPALILSNYKAAEGNGIVVLWPNIQKT